MIASERVLGLDTVRSLAILLVIIAHYSLFFRTSINVGPVLYGSGYFGVELFFALSGFLIGGIVLRTVLTADNFGTVFTFWIRRWLRTLPAYYLVLVVLAFSFHVAPHIWLLHATFLQDFTIIPRDTFFGVSWSLAIEEWFYLILPILIFGLAKHVGTKPHHVLFLCLAGIVFCFLSRIFEVIIFNPPWMEIRKSVFERMDALLFGVLLAVIKKYWNIPYHQVLGKYGFLIGCTGIFGWALFAIPFFIRSICFRIFFKPNDYVFYCVFLFSPDRSMAGYESLLEHLSAGFIRCFRNNFYQYNKLLCISHSLGYNANFYQAR